MVRNESLRIDSLMQDLWQMGRAQSHSLWLKKRAFRVEFSQFWLETRKYRQRYRGSQGRARIDAAVVAADVVAAADSVAAAFSFLSVQLSHLANKTKNQRLIGQSCSVTTAPAARIGLHGAHRHT